MNPKFRVYVSCPVIGNLSPQQESLLRGILDQIIQAGYLPLNLEDYYYPVTDERLLTITLSLDGMHSLMKECQGAMILAFSQSPVFDGSGKIIGFRPTEYNHIEGALAIAQGIPLLVIAEKEVMPRGIVWDGGGRRITYIPQNASTSWLDTNDFQQSFKKWRKAIDSRRHVFLGYCSTASSVADQAITFLEDQGIRVLDWRRDFTAGGTVLEQIEEAASRCTGGIFLFTNDDMLTKGSQKHAAPRDNVIFETGYFVQAKDKKRVLIIREGNTKLPADVGGDIYLSLQDRSDISSIKPGLMKFIQQRIL